MMKLFNVLICCISLPTCLFAQDLLSIQNMIPNTVDIRSLGMGNSEVAGECGSNAVFINPALLPLQANGSIKAGTSLKFGFIQDEYADDLAKVNDMDVKMGYKPNFNFTNLSAALPVHLKASSVPLSIGFGIGYQKAIDLSSTLYESADYSEGDIKYSYETTTKTLGGLNTISPGVAIGIYDRISAGFSLNFGFSKIKIKDKEVEEEDGEETTFESTTEAPGKSFYPTFGFVGKPLENMSIGLSITPSYSYEIKEVEVETESEEGSESESEYEGGTFTMPLKFSAGIEYKVLPTFTLAVEYQTRPFESFEFDATSTTNSPNLLSLENSIKKMKMQNGHALHVGAELIAGIVPLRAGFFLEPYLSTNEKIKNGISGYDGKPNYAIGGSFGCGIPAGEYVLIDMAAQYRSKKITHVEENPHLTTATLKKYDATDRRIRIDLGVKINLPAIKTRSTNNTTISSTSQINNNQSTVPAQTTPQTLNPPPQNYQTIETPSESVPATQEYIQEPVQSDTPTPSNDTPAETTY